MADNITKVHSAGPHAAIVISDLSSGGAQRVVMGLATHWIARGLPLAILTQSNAEDDFFQLPDGVVRIQTGRLGGASTMLSRIFANAHRILTLRKAIRASQATIVFAFLGQTIITTLLACWGLPVKIVACERNDPARQSLGQPWDWLRRRLYRRADIVTANSQTALKAMASYVPDEKLLWLPNAVPAAPDPEANPLNLSGSGSLFIAVGRLAPQKGYDILIRALARLPDNLAHWGLIIVGSGPLRDELQTLARAEGVETRIQWAGVQSNPYSYYRAGDIFVLASRHEGMPNVVLEALSVGLPVIVTDACAGALDIIEHDRSGLVVPSEDADALAVAMARLAYDADLRSRLARSGAALLEDYQPEKIMSMWDGIIGLNDKYQP